MEKNKNFSSAFVFSDPISQLEYARSHPFKPIRAKLTLDLCRRYGLMDRPWMRLIEPQPLDFPTMAEFHDETYLKILQEANRGFLPKDLWMDQIRSLKDPSAFDPKILQYGLGTEDNPIFPGVYDYATTASGGTLQLAQMIADGEIQIGFNPLGGFHHAARDHAEGFCYINDMVIAILHLLKRGWRVAVVDIDAHHGNGVQDAFYHDNRVLCISFHETGKEIYPWSGFEDEIGAGAGKGFNVNVPLPQYTDDELFEFAFEEIVPPLLYAFGPQIVMVLLGADTHRTDPLTHLNMTNFSFCRAVHTLREISPRILALGGGGYDIFKTARSWTLAWAILNEIEPVDEYAGSIGGMMFGPESDAGRLQDEPAVTRGSIRERIEKELARVVEYIKWNVFPIHNLLG
jgi:acetoin utilization protein AcuC